jgi:uncharacterized protein (TIGR02466 family)
MQPKDRMKSLEKGLALHRAGDLSAAMDIYRRVLTALPADLDALNLAADASFALGEFVDAAGFFERLAATDSEDAQTHFNLGVARRHAGRNADAASAFASVVRIDPTYPKANFNLGVALEADGRVEVAVSAYEKAVFQDPHDLGSTANLAGALAKLRVFNRALLIYESAIERWPKNSTIRVMYARALRGVKLFDRAVDECRVAISVSPNNAEAHASLGLTYARAGQNRKAVESCDEALKLDPERTETRIVMAGVLIELNEFEDALKSCEIVIDKTPDHPTARRYQAILFLRVGRIAEALENFRQLFKTNPDNIDVIAGYIDALIQSGRPLEVPEFYRMVISSRPGGPQPYTEIAKRYLEAGEPIAAFEAVSEALLRFPGDTGALAIQAISAVAAGADTVAETLHDFKGLMSRVKVVAPSGWSTVTEFNAALSEYVQNHPSARFSPAGHATQGGYHTGELLVEPAGPISGLEELIRDAVDRYQREHPLDLGHPFSAPPLSDYALNVWAIILQDAGYQIPHIHPAARISGVYYPQLPPVIDKSDTSGWIEFGRAPDQFSCGVEGEVINIQPEEGLMVLFPSYMYHRTIPFSGTGKRISVAFDVNVITDQQNQAFFSNDDGGA